MKLTEIKRSYFSFFELHFYVILVYEEVEIFLLINKKEEGKKKLTFLSFQILPFCVCWSMICIVGSNHNNFNFENWLLNMVSKLWLIGDLKFKFFSNLFIYLIMYQYVICLQLPHGSDMCEVGGGIGGCL